MSKMDRSGEEYKRRYERVLCPHEGCGELVGKQGLANHIRKHGDQAPQKSKRLPSYVRPGAVFTEKEQPYNVGYREGFSNGFRFVVERLRQLGVAVPVEKLI